MCEKSVFLSAFGFSNIAFIIPSNIIIVPYFTLWMLFFPLPSGCQTVWIQIRPDILLGLIWVEIVCKGYQQTSKCLAGSALKLFVKIISRQQKWAKSYIQKTCLYYFLAKTLAFGYNFYHLDKVLATTNSEPELALELVNAKILI